MKYRPHKIADTLRTVGVGETMTIKNVRAISVRHTARNLWGANSHTTKTSGPNRADITITRIK